MAGITKTYHKRLMESSADEWREVIRRNHQQFAQMLVDADMKAMDYKPISKKANEIFMLNMILLEKIEELEKQIK